MFALMSRNLETEHCASNWCCIGAVSVCLSVRPSVGRSVRAEVVLHEKKRGAKLRSDDGCDWLRESRSHDQRRNLRPVYGGTYNFGKG